MIYYIDEFSYLGYISISRLGGWGGGGEEYSLVRNIDLKHDVDLPSSNSAIAN